MVRCQETHQGSSDQFGQDHLSEVVYLLPHQDIHIIIMQLALWFEATITNFDQSNIY